MDKTPEQIKQICIASIRRKSRNLEKWKFTGLFDDLEKSQKEIILNSNVLEKGESPIAYTFFSRDYWNLLTTRRLIEIRNKTVKFVMGKEIQSHHFGDFKNTKESDRTTIALLKTNGEKMNFEIETGDASMVMIYGIKYLEIGHNEINHAGN